MTHKRRLEGQTILYLVTEDWYFCSHRLPLVRAARQEGARVVVAARMAGDRARIAAEGFEPVDIPFDRSGTNPWRDARTIAAIRATFRAFVPSLVHNVAVKPVVYGSLAARAAGVPVVVNAMAGLGFLYASESVKARLLRAGFRRALRRAAASAKMRMIVQNEEDRAELVHLGLPGERIVTIRGSGVDTNAFAPSPEPAGTPVAVCVSRMLWDKGIGELVEAARLLRARGLALRIRLVGGGDANPASISEEQLAAWAREGVVEVAGPSGDVAREYAEGHIAVLPSYREGLPKSLLEGAACARPLVATDVPGCRDICRDGETGLLVPAKNPQALAQALARLAGDAELRRRLGARAREVVEAEFAEEIVVAETLDLYVKLLAEAGVSAGPETANEAAGSPPHRPLARAEPGGERA
ncbi:glycosyltransferase family 4 protein [Afifella pfennigii]|uniref:glycosyltransferase family 4 protein n=1 Tax=Afifella pfennigii TaxID=209897 RepID=UPI0009FC11CC|nr:glycosyltransferase family 4 protein [Afifella pfennigii]